MFKDFVMTTRRPVGEFFMSVIEKIQQKYRDAEISTKITVTYAACFIFLLFIINSVMYVGVFYALYRPAERTIRHSMQSVEVLLNEINNEVISKHNPDPSFDANTIREPLIAGVVLRAFDDNGILLADTDAHYISNETFNENILVDPPMIADDDFDVASIGRALVYRAKMDYVFDGEHFTLYFFRTITSEQFLIDRLERLLLILDIIGIGFAVLVGTAASRKVLKPIKTMTQHAKNIAFGRMDGRIAIPAANDELTELAVTFNDMLDRLQGGINRQQKFVSDASHELRTPAAVFTNYIELLEKYGKDDKSLFDESIDAIRSEAKYLQSLLENLLFLARTDQNRQVLRKENLELSEIVDSVMKTTARIANNHHIHLLENDAATIYGDDTTIRQLLRIFLDNAMKYTPAGGDIIVNSESRDGKVYLSISDTGIGIAPENLDKVFDRFFRVDSEDLVYDAKGSGLGLSIAKWIADNHRIKIAVASELGKGTTFTLEIPEI